MTAEEVAAETEARLVTRATGDIAGADPSEDNRTIGRGVAAADAANADADADALAAVAAAAAAAPRLGAMVCTGDSSAAAVKSGATSCAQSIGGANELRSGAPGVIDV